jgi:hypothetical protein
LTETYDKKKVEHLNNIIANFDSLKDYLEDEAITNMNNIFHKVDPITPTEESYIL